MKHSLSFRLSIGLLLMLCSWLLWADSAQIHNIFFNYGAVALLPVMLIIYWNISVLRQVIQQSQQLELALRHNEAKLNAIINACPIPLALNDNAQNITFVNPEFTRRFGYTVDDIPTLTDWWHKAYPDPDYRRWIITTWANALDNAKREQCAFEPLEITICCKNGTTRTVMVSADSLSDTFDSMHLVILYDVTTRKMAESALQQSLLLLQSVIDNVPIRVFWKDTQCRYLGCNNTFANDAGFTRVEQLIGKDDTMMGWKNQAALYQAADRKVMATAVAELNFEEQQTTSDGNKIWLRTSKVPLHDEVGQVIGVLGIYQKAP